MARGKSVKLLAAIPAKYRPDFIERVDRRTVLGRAVYNRYHSVIADLGGDEALSTIKRSHVRRLVTLECMIEGIECHALAGEPVDVGCWVQMVNSWLGVARVLGLERKARNVRTLREVMNAPEARTLSTDAHATEPRQRGAENGTPSHRRVKGRFVAAPAPSACVMRELP